MDNAGVPSVICLSTGTKCINGEMMSLTGQSLNDCHAEVVVRRCLVYWLYSRLEEALSGQSDVLQPSQTGGVWRRQDLLSARAAGRGDQRADQRPGQAGGGE